MTDQPAAFKGTFHDMKFVKGRKQAQIIVEIPIEHAAAVVAAFGAPNPENPVWIALARLDIQPAKEEPKPKNREAQKAAILCDDVRFQSFLWSEFEIEKCDVRAARTDDDNEYAKGAAADFIRDYCGVDSRKELTADNVNWRALQARFDVWCNS